jgi:hypothetical protein
MMSPLVRRVPTTSAEAWPEIDQSLLDEGRWANVPPLPVDVLPPAWGQWVTDTAQAAGTPVDYVVQGVLAAVAGVCGAGVVARVTPSWAEPMILWQALLGAPSSGKSPALAAVRRLLGEIEGELRSGDPGRRARHARKVEAARLLTEQWRDNCETAVKLGTPAPDKPVDAEFDEAFVPGQIAFADSTMEALADVVSGNPLGVILWRDELAAWLANLNRYANGGSDRAHWLEAWSAAGITINRRSRTRPLHLPKFPVSVVGTIQPDRIADALAGDDDGLAARFLYAWPDPPAYTSLLDRRTPDDDGALARLQSIARLAQTPDEPRRLTFDTQAIVLLDDFMEELHRAARGLDGLEASWLGKGPGTVARLALALALLDWSDSGAALPPGMIESEHVSGAIRLWNDYFRRHALAVFNQAGRADRDRLAKRALHWIKSTAPAEVSREMIRCDALSYAVDAEGADKVIARLEQGGILQALPAESGKRGGRPARRWAVNPGLD